MQTKKGKRKRKKEGKRDKVVCGGRENREKEAVSIYGASISRTNRANGFQSWTKYPQLSVSFKSKENKRKAST